MMIHNQMSHNQAKNGVFSLIYRAAIDFKNSKKNWKHRAPVLSFFFGFFKIDCCSIYQTKYPIFCLIMTHLVMNHQISHSEVKFFYKKKFPWVFLSGSKVKSDIWNQIRSEFKIKFSWSNVSPCLRSYFRIKPMYDAC